MRRTAACLVVCSLIVVLSGCKIFQRKSAAPLNAFDSYAFSATAQPPLYEPLDLPAYDPTSLVVTPGEADWTAISIGGTAPTSLARYHTVVKKDTLYSLARQYYGDQSKWKEIYATNRTDISDPNRISVGQRLLIP